MTTDASSVGRRPRFSMGQLMALVGASAAVVAFYFEMARQAAIASAFNAQNLVDPVVLTASIVVAAISVAALRRSSPTGMLLALGLSASAMALYGGLRYTRFIAVGPPAFALLTVAVPLWIRRELGADPSARTGWSRRLVLAGRVGLDSSLNLLGLVILLLVYEAVGGALPPAPPAFMIGSGPAVYPSASSSVVLTSGVAPLPPPLPMNPVSPGVLPEFAPPPPEIDIVNATPGP